MTRELKIMCGVPGVGKSYWVHKEAQRLEEDGFSTAIISRDAIRFKLLDERGDEDYFAYENEVFSEFIHQINEVLELGIDYVFVDATHISPSSRMKVLERLVIDPSTNVKFEVFNLPIEVALYRNGLREGRARVPVSAIKSMYRNFKAPSKDEIVKIKRVLGWKNDIDVRFHKKEE